MNTLQFHQLALDKLCRVCTKLNTNNSYVAVNCAQYRKELEILYSINIWLDDSTRHPNKLCWRCVRNLTHCKQQTREFEYSSATQNTTDEWPTHSRSGTCTTCEQYRKVLKGGRPVKRNRTGKGLPNINPPSLNKQDCEKSYLFNFATNDSAYTVPPNLDILGTEKAVETIFICAICQCILSSPSVQTQCEHNYCSSCLEQWFVFRGSHTVPCPVCQVSVNHDNVTSSPRILRLQLSTLTTVCTVCGTIGKLSKMANHVCPEKDKTPSCNCDLCSKSANPIQTYPETSTVKIHRDEIIKAANLLKQVAVEHSRGTPIPAEIEEVSDRWTWLKLSAHKGNDVRLKTPGRPLFVQKIAHSSIKSPRKSTKSGPPNDGIHDPDTSIAMMRDCQLAWEQIRKIKRYLGSVGVSFSSERAMRKRQNELLNDNLTGSLVPLIFTSDKPFGRNGVESREVPCVTVKNLSTMILDYLDRHDLHGSLTWHDGVIPENEVWIKVGGDKGGTSFKMSFQIVNTHHPNSLQNTVVFACFEANDSIVNLQAVLPPVMEQVSQLAGQKWRGKAFRLFLFGDYELLTKMYGICSCNARYCCLYCTTSKENMKLPITERATATPRTLQSIYESYKAYEADGSMKARAKLVSHSIIAKPIIDIAIDHVVLPSLHISLGIYKKLFDMYEARCHKLDLKIFELLVKHADEDDMEASDTNFDQKVAWEFNHQKQLARDKAIKQDELEQIEEELPLHLLQHNLQNADQMFQQMANRAFILRNELKQLNNEKAELPIGAGPVAGSLDVVLKRHHVERQAYHGKAFVGNHVHKCCQIRVISDLTHEPRRILQSVSNDDIPLKHQQELIREAAKLGSTFEDIFLKFADAHFAINHRRALSPDDLNRIDMCIKVFMASYRESFPESSITPKMHLLENHAVEQLSRFGVGFGLLNEQGGELIHTEFNRTGRVVQGMRDALQRLMTTMRRHHLSTTPEVQAKVITCGKKAKIEE